MHYALDVALIYQLSFITRYADYIRTRALRPPEMGDELSLGTGYGPVVAWILGYWVVRIFPLSIAPTEVALLLIMLHSVRSSFLFIVLLVFIEGIHVCFGLPFPLYVGWRRFTILLIPGFLALEILFVMWKFGLYELPVAAVP